MVEPTESEPKEELDRFCEALNAIRVEIQAVVDGVADPVGGAGGEVARFFVGGGGTRIGHGA